MEEVKPYGPQLSKLMIVLDYPSTAQVQQGQEFHMDKTMATVLFDVVGIKKDEVYITYAVKDSDGKPTNRQIVDAREALEAEINAVCPETIVTMGDIAMTMVTGTKGITKNRGKFLNASKITGEGRAVSVIPTYSPSYIQLNSANLNLWAKDINAGYLMSEGEVPTNSPTKIVACDTIPKVKQLIKYCLETKFVVFDFETPNIEDQGTFAKGFHATVLSISFQAGSSYVIPIEHKDSPFTTAEVSQIMELLRKYIFENRRIRKVAQNIAYDAHIFRIYGISIYGRLDDTMLMHHLIDETQPHGLKDMVAAYYPEFTGYDDIIKGMKYADIPLKPLSVYAGTDTDMTCRLCTLFESILLADEKKYNIYRNLTMPAMKALFAMEVAGMDIDTKQLGESIIEVKKIMRQQKQRILKIREVAYYEEMVREEQQAEAIEEVQGKLKDRTDKSKEMAEAKAVQRLDSAVRKAAKAGEEFKYTQIDIDREAKDCYVTTATETKIREKMNDLKSGKIQAYPGINFASPKQLQELLYLSDYGYRFNAEEASTGKDVLAELDDTTGFIEGLVTYRSIKKTLGTYLEGIQKRVDGDGKLHTNFKIHGTKSGRLSSANPNLQNIPNTAKLKNELEIKVVGLVKKAFIPPVGWEMHQYDYSQAELRIIAEFADETNMLEAYANGQDLHALTAAAMLGVTIEQFYELDPKAQKSARQKAKAVNFGLIYLISIEGFMEYAKNQYGVIVTYDEAVDIFEAFFAKYPKLQDYHDTYIAKAKKFGYVRTLFGRTRQTPDINHPDGYFASMDERVSVNSPIQGTAGEYTIFAVALLNLVLDPAKVIAVNTVHDSIIFYVKKGERQYAIDTIKPIMENLPTEQYFGRKLEKVGMKVDVEVSDVSWKDLQEIQ